MSDEEAAKREARIIELETRLAKIEGIEKARAESAATFPVEKPANEKLKEESLEVFGELSAYYIPNAPKKTI